jgi:uncharacterized protein
MRLRPLSQLLMFSAFTVSLHAADPAPATTPSTAPAPAEGPAKDALNAFKEARYAKAVQLAIPLAEQGDPEALYLLGFAYESGKGVDASRENALNYYRKAIGAKNKDAVYRLAFILLASDKEEERTQAREALETAAKDDPTVAGRILGEAYLQARLSPAADPEKAVFWWKRAADAGDSASLLLLARFYEGQFGFPELKNPKEVIASYTKAAGLGDPGAMAALGSRLLSGDEKTRDEAKGREWLKKAIEAKEYSAYLALGDFEENVKKNLKAALAEYERGKDVGQIECMLRTADFYLQGKGVEKDSARGLALMEKAAEAGSPMANYRLAVQALAGQTPDLLKGYKFLLVAANGNMLEAQNEIGLLYLSGKLNGVDSLAGVAWLNRAAQAGYAQAQNNLGTLYERGMAGVPQNIENAGQLYVLAANQGNGPATLALARLLFEGIGTKADPIKAWCFASLAQERGEETAKAIVDQIAATLDDKQKIEAKKQLEDMKSGKSTQVKPATDTKTPAPASPKKGN